MISEKFINFQNAEGKETNTDVEILKKSNFELVCICMN